MHYIIIRNVNNFTFKVMGKYLNKKYSSSTDRSDMFYWQGDRPFTFEETNEIFLNRFETFDEKLFIEMFNSAIQRSESIPNNLKVVELFEPIRTGSVNINVKAKLSDGTIIHGRFHPKGIPNGYFYAEKCAIDLARKNNIPTCKVQYIDDSLEEYPFAYMVSTNVNGTIMKSIDFEKNKKLEKKLVIETGFYAGKINSIKVEKFGFFNNDIAKEENKLVGIHESFKKHFYASLENSMKYLLDAETISKETLGIIEEKIKSREDLLDIKQGYLIHNDIADWNEIVDEENEKISGIMDWDECFSGDPVMELAAWNLFFGGERYNWYIDGYKAANGSLPEGYEEKISLYKLRYVIAKASMRRKKIMQNGMKEKLDFALKSLEELLLILK